MQGGTVSGAGANAIRKGLKSYRVCASIPAGFVSRRSFEFHPRRHAERFVWLRAVHLRISLRVHNVLETEYGSEADGAPFGTKSFNPAPSASDAATAGNHPIIALELADGSISPMKESA